MSEFTYGNIIRASDKTKLVEHLPTGTPTLKLSEDWFAFFTPKDGEFVASQQLKTLSAYCPIMYFTHLEDHGWGFEIFNKGEVVSDLQIMYGLTDEEVDELLAEYEGAEDTFLDGYLKQNPRADAFSVFDLTKEQIKSLEELFAGNVSFEKGEFEAVEKFKEILGIEEMSLIRYERTEGREEIEYI
ncbi:hypothetical protein I6N90_21040 [Paenibacillus sp. GSMTC-2017]|uniref:hypothetical protein n=1 Tax=Paenibacillus sp. GSMTC-2017 TaxID=2794350 RepID=UPI0018D5B28F|nr:hypothetical protein [Paenibacillus sp. GSMTC-2017]MBH5320280.1 hypothetical protein [Paenibacillus sp. GSMTC-2017]